MFLVEIIKLKSGELRRFFACSWYALLLSSAYTRILVSNKISLFICKIPKVRNSSKFPFQINSADTFPFSFSRGGLLFSGLVLRAKSKVLHAVFFQKQEELNKIVRVIKLKHQFSHLRNILYKNNQITQLIQIAPAGKYRTRNVHSFQFFPS